MFLCIFVVSSCRTLFIGTICQDKFAYSFCADLQDPCDTIFQVGVWANDGDAVFIREFTLIRRDHLPEEPLHDSSQKTEDPVSAWSENTSLTVSPQVDFPMSLCV